MLEHVWTERLVGRRPREDDADVLGGIWTDHRIDEATWPADLRTADDAGRTVADDLAHWERFGFGPWIVEERRTGAVIGRAGLKHTQVNGRPEVEIAYFLSADHWGRGYATEIAREAVRAAFEDLGLDDVVVFTTVANEASQAIIARLGATFEAELEHAGLPHVLFRLRRPEAPGTAA
jgi:RimJ/RimL family protein N-acetyltransferase